MDEFASPTGIDWVSQHVGTVQYGGGDRGQVVMFFNKAVHNPAKSTDEGRPIYEDQVFVRIHPPGERLNIIERPATENDMRRWPQQYAQFRQNKSQVPDGTPVELLYPEYPSIGATLRAHGVMTIEMCAELSGNAIENIGMGAQKYVNAAIKYMEAANKGIGIAQFRREIEDRDRQIRVLTQQMGELQHTIQQLQKADIAGSKLKEVQQLIAGVMGRPEHPSSGIDTQSAMISANHQTAQISRRQRAALKEEPAPRRQRPKLRG